MKNSDRVERKIDQTLKVLDDMQRAEPKPFFYTRLQARMQTKTEVAPKWSTRPAMIWSGLILIILLNIGMAINYSRKGNYRQSEQNASSFAEEYGLTIDEPGSN